MLDDVITAHATYIKLVKGHRNLKKEIAEHIAAALPEGLALEWGPHTAPIVFPAQDQVYKIDGMPAHDCDPDDPDTLWVPQDIPDPEFSYCIGEKLTDYKNQVRGLSRTALRTLFKTWNELPRALLDLAYGDATVRVLWNGKLTVEP